MTAITPELLHELAERVARPDFETLQKQLRSTGYCARPVLLDGYLETRGADGRWRSTWSTMTQPDGVLRKACGNRREAVCPVCAERYRQDAYHLIAAGLRGGKGVPDSVTEHPMVFVTLTAPTFGRGALARDRTRRATAALPATTRRAGLPARHRAQLHAHPRRERSVPRRAAVSRVLRLRRRAAVEQPARRAVAPHDDLPPARARAARPG